MRIGTRRKIIQRLKVPVQFGYRIHSIEKHPVDSLHPFGKAVRVLNFPV